MERKIHFYVKRNSVLTWMMMLCMICSALTRMVLPGWKGTGETLTVWSQILLPIAAAMLYMLIVLLRGDEMFYKTAIPVWMMAGYAALWVHGHVDSKLLCWLASTSGSADAVLPQMRSKLTSHLVYIPACLQNDIPVATLALVIYNPSLFRCEEVS